MEAFAVQEITDTVDHPYIADYERSAGIFVGNQIANADGSALPDSWSDLYAFLAADAEPWSADHVVVCTDSSPVLVREHVTFSTNDVAEVPFFELFV